MGRRLAMVAAEGNYTSPWILAMGRELEVHVTGSGTIVMELESRDGTVRLQSLLDGSSKLDDMKAVKRYRVLKTAVASDTPTTVEVIY